MFRYHREISRVFTTEINNMSRQRKTLWKRVLSKLSAEDKRGDGDCSRLFEQPVVESYPAVKIVYLQAIRNPMDLLTVLNMVNKGLVTSDEHFVELIDSIWLNCIGFNIETPLYYNRALTMQQFGATLFEEEGLPSPKKKTPLDIVLPGCFQLEKHKSQYLPHPYQEQSVKPERVKRKATPPPVPEKRKTRTPQPKKVSKTVAVVKKTPNIPEPALKLISEDQEARRTSPLEEQVESLRRILSSDLKRIQTVTTEAEKQSLLSELLEYKITSEELLVGLKKENADLRRTMNLMKSKLDLLCLSKDRKSESKTLIRSHCTRSPSAANRAKRGATRVYGNLSEMKSSNEQIVIPPRPLMTSGKVILHRVRNRSSSPATRRSQATVGYGSDQGRRGRSIPLRSLSPTSTAVSGTTRRSTSRKPSSRTYERQQSTASPILEKRLRHLERQHRQLQSDCSRILSERSNNDNPISPLTPVEDPGPWHYYNNNNEISLSDTYTSEDNQIHHHSDYDLQLVTCTSETCWM